MRTVSLLRVLMVSIIGLGTLAAGFHRADASVIGWGSAQNISGDADVSTTGTLVGAFNVAGATTTVNGVTFQASDILSSPTSGNFAFNCAPNCGSGNDTSATPPFSNLSAAYRTLLASFDLAPNPLTLTMSALTPGSTYQFEWWLNVTAAIFFGQGPFDVTATAGNPVTLVSNTTGADGGLGQFAIGTFIADASGQEIISFSSTGSVVAGLGLHLDGFELRQVPIPEPGSLILLGTAVIGFGVVRRRWRVFPGQPHLTAS